MNLGLVQYIPAAIYAQMIIYISNKFMKHSNYIIMHNFINSQSQKSPTFWTAHQGNVVPNGTVASLLYQSSHDTIMWCN